MRGSVNKSSRVLGQNRIDRLRVKGAKFQVPKDLEGVTLVTCVSLLQRPSSDNPSRKGSG